MLLCSIILTISYKPIIPMPNFQQKKKIRGVLYSVTMLLVIAVVICLLANGAYDMYGKFQDTQKNKNTALAKLEDLKNQEANLEQTVNKLNTDEGVESAIRDKFRVTKDGEGVVVIVSPDDTGTVTPDATGSGFWNFFKNLVQ